MMHTTKEITNTNVVTTQSSEKLTPAQIRERYDELMKTIDPELLQETRHALTAAASKEHASPKEILNALAKIPALEFLLNQDCRIPENYLIGEHESNWLGAFEKYIANDHVTLPLTDAEIRIMGALHDIGKPLPDNKSDQYEFTLKVISEIKEALPLEQSAFRILCSVIGNDPLGRFVVSNFERQATMDQRKAIAGIAQSRLLEISELKAFADIVKLKEPTEATKDSAIAIANEIRIRAKALDIPPIQLFHLHLVSYLCDVGAYTYDAISFNGKRAKPGIEFVFTLNPNFKVGLDNNLFLKDSSNGAMQVSPGVKALFDLIEEAVLAGS